MASLKCHFQPMPNRCFAILAISQDFHHFSHFNGPKYPPLSCRFSPSPPANKRGGVVRGGARRVAPPRFPTVPPPLLSSCAAASPRQPRRCLSQPAVPPSRRPRHRTGRPRGIHGGEDPSGRRSRRRGGVGGWEGGEDDREEEEGRGCGGHGRCGWRRLAAYQPPPPTPLPPCRLLSHQLRRRCSPPPPPPGPVTPLSPSPSDREAAEKVGEADEAIVGAQHRDVQALGVHATSVVGGFLFLLGLHHGELSVAIRGRTKGILGSPGEKSGGNGMKWRKWQNKCKPSLNNGILTTPFHGMALW
uniref:Uncharacterized protein n=1 Tax=Oryza meridionalis TaxID=40149 RepID=A0A0E0EA91_9ORYZ